jgi:hypothetical protein
MKQSLILVELMVNKFQQYQQNEQLTKYLNIPERYRIFNELKILHKDSSFYPNPLTSVAILVSGWSISKKSSHLKPLSKMNQSLIGSFYERSSIKIAHFVLICF